MSMKNEYVRGLKESLEFWVDFNSKTPMTLLDVSKLITIMRRYYVMYPRKETLNKQNTSQVKR